MFLVGQTVCLVLGTAEKAEPVPSSFVPSFLVSTEEEEEEKKG